MFSISNKTKTLIFFSLFYLNGYAQDNVSKDTTRSVVICQSTLSYPRSAQDNNISGTVVVLFDIDSNCRLTNIRIEKGIGYGCDEEAIKALKKCKPIFDGTKKSCTPILNLRQPFTFKNPDDD
jgi:TonB family protein